MNNVFNQLKKTLRKRKAELKYQNYDNDKTEKENLVQQSPIKPKVDLVNHPPHYTAHPSGVECIEITRHMNFCLGSALKYIWRADLKENAIQDLEKAIFYIKDEINRRKKIDK